MEDKSFINLLQEKNFERIIIDPRLEDSFKRVMNKIQAYFNANGYTSERDYSKFFEEFLLTDEVKKLKIYADGEPTKIGAAGLYSHRGDDVQIIHVDESYLNSNELLDSILCHEFIHFLVMRPLQYGHSDPQIIGGGFINEALTEMLTQQIYPNSNSYEPQVNMMKFANLLTDKVNNYSYFLRGYIDSKGGASSWNHFVELVTQYQNKMRGKPFIMSEAALDKLYIDAQQYIIQANISPHSINNFLTYEKCIDILSKRPAQDNEWIENFELKMDQFLVKNSGIRDEVLSNIYLHYLKDYRNIASEIQKYDGKDVIEFELAGQKVALDENRKLHGVHGGWSISWNPNNGICKVQIGNESKEFNFNDIDFSKRKSELLERKNNMSKYFSKSLFHDIKAINSISQTEGLVKLQRFELPAVGTAKSQKKYIYIATYKDRIEVLDSAMQLGSMDNVNLAKYIGVTSLENGAIYSQPMDKVEKGIVVSGLNQKQLQLDGVAFLEKQIIPNLTQEQIVKILEQYRKSDEYDLEDENDQELLKNNAIRYYSKLSFEALNDNEKKDIYSKVAESQTKYLISTKNGEIQVSILFGKEYVTAYLGDGETLLGEDSKGLWNDYYNQLRNQQVQNKKNDYNGQSVSIDQNGNIIYSNLSNDNEQPLNTSEEELNRLNAQVNELSEQYRTVTAQMEELMKRNQQFPIPNFVEQLKQLQQKRYEINNQMGPVISSQKFYQGVIEQRQETEHKAILSQVERLLSIHITPVSEFAYDNDLKVPRVIPKDANELSKEQGIILQQLDSLYMNGDIDLRKKQTMAMEIIREYENMKKKLPKPSTKDESLFIEKEELSPSEIRKPYISDSVKQEVIEHIDPKKSYYDDSRITDLEKQKLELEEQRKELLRKQLAQRKKEMGIDTENIIDFEELARREEITDSNDLNQEVEGHAMHM